VLRVLRVAFALEPGEARRMSSIASRTQLRPFMALALMLALAGCVTPWRPRVFPDGVEAEQVGRHRWHIFVRGNDFPSDAVANDFMLLDAAQTTIARGGTHFVVLGTSGDGIDAGPDHEPSLGRDAVIRIVTVGYGARPPWGAIDADRLLRFIRAKLSARHS
jgi:hypothetical protein